MAQLVQIEVNLCGVKNGEIKFSFGRKKTMRTFIFILFYFAYFKRHCRQKLQKNAIRSFIAVF